MEIARLDNVDGDVKKSALGQIAGNLKGTAATFWSARELLHLLHSHFSSVWFPVSDERLHPLFCQLDGPRVFTEILSKLIECHPDEFEVILIVFGRILPFYVASARLPTLYTLQQICLSNAAYVNGVLHLHVIYTVYLC